MKGVSTQMTVVTGVHVQCSVSVVSLALLEVVSSVWTAGKLCEAKLETTSTDIVYNLRRKSIQDPVEQIGLFGPRKRG